MKLKLFLAALVACASGCSVAVHRAEPVQTEAQVSAELMQIERDIGAANIRRDKAYFQRIEADEFLFTGANGSVTTKAQDVASLDEPPGDWVLEAYDPDDMKVYVYGATAVVFGRTTTRVKNAKTAEVRTSQTRFTDTFVRRDGQWVLVAGHSSRIPAPKP
jgi:hypothetical protein